MKKLNLLLAVTSIFFSIESSSSSLCEDEMKRLASPVLKEMDDWASRELTDSMVDAAKKSYAQAYAFLDSKDPNIKDRTHGGLMSLVDAVKNGHPDAFEDLISMGGGFFLERYGIKAFLKGKDLHTAKATYALPLRMRWNLKVSSTENPGVFRRVLRYVFGTSEGSMQVAEGKRRISDTFVSLDAGKTVKGSSLRKRR